MILLLLGMRGVGKTTLGMSMATIFSGSGMSCEVIDVDAKFTEYLTEESEEPLSISEYVRLFGWVLFREAELKCLSQIVNMCKEEKLNIIITGGGIVENAASKVYLESLVSRSDVISIHILRENMKQWTSAIDSLKMSSKLDENRPPYGEPVGDVWDRRSYYYKTFSNIDFVIKDNESKEITSLRFFNTLRYLILRDKTYLLKQHCFVLEEIEHLRKIPREMMLLADCLEYRADRIDSEESLGHNLYQLKEISNGKHILYTDRSKGEGGAREKNLSDDDYYASIENAVRSGLIDIIDIEYLRLLHWQNSSKLANLRSICVKNKIAIVISMHVLDQIITKENFTAKINEILAFADSMQNVSTVGKIILAEYPDGISETWTDYYQNEIQILSCPGPKLICNVLGPSNKESRFLNYSDSPIVFISDKNDHTAGLLKFPADAMNQSYKTIIRFCLFGGNPSLLHTSLSPPIHNFLFESLRIANCMHYDTPVIVSNTAMIVDYIIGLGNQFGGASVTNPLKREIKRNEIVNTIIAKLPQSLNEKAYQKGQEKEFLSRFSTINTDKMAIRDMLIDRIPVFSTMGIEDTGVLDVIAIGAGATVESVLLALTETYRDRLARLLIINRTITKAKMLMNPYRSFFNGNSPKTYRNLIVVYSLPASVCEVSEPLHSIDSDLMMEGDTLQALDGFFQNPFEKIFLLDVHYTRTSLEDILKNCHSILRTIVNSYIQKITSIQLMDGLELLVRQALYQNEAWILANCSNLEMNHVYAHKSAWRFLYGIFSKSTPYSE